MKRYGFLKCFPIVCYRDKEGNLIVKDGQHRLAIAEELGITVWWVQEETDFDVAVTNKASKGWSNKDYALRYAAAGVAAYTELLEFSERYKVCVSLSAAMLGGTTVFQNIADGFYTGKFKIKDRKWADAVAGIYSQMTRIGPALKNNHFLGACMAVCRVTTFDSSRLIGGAERCRDKLVPYANRDAYLGMIEEVYNFGRKQLVSIKNEAMMIMKERNPNKAKNKPPESKDAA